MEKLSILQVANRLAGLHEISPIPPVEQLVGDMLKYCLDPSDKDRAFVEFKQDDVVCLLINNFGGMSNFEIEALTSVSRKVLEREWNITPKRIYAQCFETSLNAPGWSISLLNVSGIERETKTTITTLLYLLDMETTAPSWPRNGYRDIIPVKETAQLASKGAAEEVAQKGPNVDPMLLDSALRTACNAAIKAEPDITKWDIQMGDGDCGEAVVGMCQGVLKKLDAGLAKDGSFFHILDEVGEAVEEIGGTLGAIISIILASFTTNLRQAYSKNESSFVVDTKSAGQAAGTALNNLMGYTSARVGGRTVMDTLIPFCQTLEKDVDLAKAVDAAEQGSNATSGMKAKFGRGESTSSQSQSDPRKLSKA